MRIPEEARRCVVFIGGLLPNGTFVPFGTAFLAAVPTAPSVGFKYLVTAKHVVRDIEDSKLPMALRVNLKAGGAAAGRFEPTWFSHPTIPDLDLLISPLDLDNNTFDAVHIQSDEYFLTDEFIAAHDIGAGDEVFVTGLLTRHFGRDRNIPIVRMGNIAAMPDEPIDLGEGHGSHELYLIESRSIGGLSGSPVHLQVPLWRNYQGKITPMTGHPAILLLGMNIGLFETRAHADRAPGELPPREAFLETMSAGIAVVIPAKRILEALDHPDQLQRRHDYMEKRKKRDTGFVPTSAGANFSAVTAIGVEPESDNPTHKEDFTRLLNAAARKRPQGDQT